MVQSWLRFFFGRRIWLILYENQKKKTGSSGFEVENLELDNVVFFGFTYSGFAELFS